jgi:hypothetical protein
MQHKLLGLSFTEVVSQNMSKTRFPKWPGWSRVGESAEKRAKWLLEFGRIDLNKVSRNRRLTLRKETRAFIALSIAHPHRRPQMMFLPMPQSVAVSEAFAREVHDWLRDGLEKFSRGEEWVLQQPAIEYGFARLRGAVGWRIRSDSDLDNFKAGTCEALRHALPHIRFCAEKKCHWPLIAGHGRTIYCSARCSQTTRMRKFRNKKTRQKLGLSEGSNVKVGRDA